MLSILWEYLVLLCLPWGVFPSIDLNPTQIGDTLTDGWAILAMGLLAFFGLRQRSRRLLGLGIFTLITLVPVLPFPFLEHRYVYLPIISVAIILGWLFQRAHAHMGQWRGFAFAAAVGFALLAFGNGVALNDSMTAAADWARTLRVPFRDIERQNPTFPKDTLLYFIAPITPTEGGLSGMFFLRYGKDIAVRNWTQSAGLREHNAAYVYYFDDARRPQKVDVDKRAVTRVSPGLPASFEGTITLEGYETPQTIIKLGAPIVLISYWRTRERLDRDYVLFVHLVDRNGKIVAQSDGQPRKGQAPTSRWEPQLLYVDAIVMPVGADVPTGGGYQLKFGLYDPKTLERLGVIDARGQSVTDMIEIGSFTIE